MTRLRVDASVGDVLDRLTILDIKLARIVEPARRANVERERDALEAAWAKAGLPARAEVPEAEALALANAALWDVEDALRMLEARREFGDEFVALARRVYALNDGRADVKRRVNERFGSWLVEEKQHPAYPRGTISG